MRIHLVRHGRGVARSEFRAELRSRLRSSSTAESARADHLRPLGSRGREQALALADQLRDGPPSRLISSPALRCQQTVEALALEHGLEIEVDDRLAEDEDLSRTVELLAEIGSEPVLFCTHSRIVSGLLTLLELADEDPTTCRKGAMWVLEGPGALPISARYEEPVRRRVRDARDAGRAAFPSVRAAVLDMGSTSFNLLIADVIRGDEIRPVVREKVMLRLGAAIASGDKIPNEASRRAVSVARELRGVIRQEKVQRVLPVATAALREARNGAKLADKLGKALGTPVRILSGEEEARLMFRAFQRRLRLGSEPVLGLDLGGGSLEIAAGCGERIDTEVTLPLGVVRLHGELGPGDPMRTRDLRRIRRRVREALDPHVDELLARGAVAAIAAGGTVRALARLVAAGPGPAQSAKAATVRLATSDLHELGERLASSAHEERLRMPGMRRRRVDLLPTGAIVLSCVAEGLGLDAVTLCDWGLREGVILDAIAPDA